MTTSTTSGSQDGRCRLAWWTLAIALICGGLLRSVWIEDMEWKEDERWSYRMSQEVGRTRPWPWVGMPTSLGFANPGLSVWMFVAIGRMVNTPTSMARVVVLLNMVALIGFAGAVRAYVPLREREPWLWGIALQAVSPFAIRLSRKIWPPSILTPFLLLLWISHQHRRARWGAFAWGLVGAVIGQVHLSGWFVATGLALGTLVAECRSSVPRSRYWHWWLFGSVLGLISALPWARALPTSTLPTALTGIMTMKRIPGYLYGLAVTASSVLPYSVLGLGHDARDFEVHPIIDGVRTHIPELLRLLIVLAVALRIVVRLIVAIVAPGLRRAWRLIAHGAGRRPDEDASASSEPAQAGGECASTAFYLWSTMAIPGVIFVMTTNVYFYHYYFVLCPFLFVLIAVCLLPWRRVLLGLVVAQALLSYAFLSYVHQKGGTSRGEYGLTYARQGNR
ncbi:MAG: hypothetical protein ACHRXM_25905 [Isosphaerales bacterium]